MNNCLNDSGDLLIASANELTRVKELRKQIKGGKLFGFLFGGGFKGVKQFREIEQQLDELVFTVDKFYALLGKRGWIFVECFDWRRIRLIVGNDDTDSAEKELVQYFQEGYMLEFGINRMSRFEDMRPRLHLIEKAKCDYLEGRYYSTVLVLISVMDGFVNDIDKACRRGLHARYPEEMYTEDCVATMWSGLPEVQRRFIKSFKAREETEVYDVFRNGIVHGMVMNYDNVVVASKAWCMLFAICDWAENISLEKHQKKDLFEQSDMSCRSFLNKIIERKKEIERKEEYLRQWKSHNVDLENPSKEDSELLISCRDYFDAWVAKNYGKLSGFFLNYTKKSKSGLAGEARHYYSNYEISEYQILSIDRKAAAVAEVCAIVTSGEGTWTPTIRFVRMDKNLNVCCDQEPGGWKVVGYASDPFADRKTLDQKT